MGIQASALSQLMNPTTLRRVYDNEFRVPADEDAVTLFEILNKVTSGLERAGQRAKRQIH